MMGRFAPKDRFRKSLLARSLSEESSGRRGILGVPYALRLRKQLSFLFKAHCSGGHILPLLNSKAKDGIPLADQFSRVYRLLRIR